MDVRLFLHLAFRPVGTGMLHVGVGAGGEALLPVMRAGGRPYVPPSSVKGVFRRIVEHLVKGSLDSLSGVDRVMAEAHAEGREGVTHGTRAAEELGKLLVTETDDAFADEVLAAFVPRDDIALLREEGREPGRSVIEPLLSALCPICRLLGSQGVAGSVRVVGVELREASIAHRPHVGIDRSSRTREERVLYVEEVLQLEGLDVHVVVDDPQPGSPESMAIAGLLEYLSTVGLQLGGSRSRGLGAFLLDPEASRGLIVDYRRAGSGDELASMLALRPEDVAARGERLDAVLRFLRGAGCRAA